MVPVNEAGQNQHSTTLLGVDRAGSVLTTQSDHQRNSRSYTVYGDMPSVAPESCKTGFVGELLDALGGHYLLGNGVRAYAQALMRFRSPDVLSPFGAGGTNSYAYCSGDPVNFVDRTGRNQTGIGVPSLRVMARNAIPQRYQSHQRKTPLNIELESYHNAIVRGQNPFWPFPSSVSFETRSLEKSAFSNNWSKSNSDQHLSNFVSASHALDLLLVTTPPYMKTLGHNKIYTDGGGPTGIKALGMYDAHEKMVLNTLENHLTEFNKLHTGNLDFEKRASISEALSSSDDVKAVRESLEAFKKMHLDSYYISLARYEN